MMENCKLVYGLKCGNKVFESEDVVIFKLKNESKEYQARLYDFHEDYCEAYLCGKDDNDDEFYIDYDKVEWMRKVETA